MRHKVLIGHTSNTGFQQPTSHRRTVSAMHFDNQPSKRPRLSPNPIRSVPTKYGRCINRTSEPNRNKRSKDQVLPIPNVRRSSTTGPRSDTKAYHISFSLSLSAELNVGLQTDSFSLLGKSIEFELPPASLSSLPPSSPVGNSSSQSNSSERPASVDTPKRDPCPPTCFCLLGADTFGKDTNVDACQLVEGHVSPASQLEKEGIVGQFDANVRRMLIPKELWSQFKPIASSLCLGRTSKTIGPTSIVYRRHAGLNLPIPIYDEDLWADEGNPFLLREEELSEINSREGYIPLPLPIELSDPADALLLESMIPLFREKGTGLGISMRV